ncbi:type II toxin-antitoxin system RelE/ParE family toxin [Sphingomonas sp. LB-2]|uniref:type II toxin-antitoxin system RelE/ParE family toxin n=1 Tax=Sphingomonas caeni TaxID=2984949 RepID=UPI00222E3567|nr:type II toxin-antitoxin system RelE/ParE family toxin [Sphingomonas caeni]MCW3847848.1 type II toxin-antitoxin system RelE/ParE family toxin [Sphingomonas caeni]
MRQLRYTDTAESDLAEIALYIADQSGHRAVAEAFVSRLRDQCRKLAVLPGILGTARPELRPDIRSTPCQGYTIFFRYLGDTVQIVSVLGAHRDIEGYFAP